MKKRFNKNILFILLAIAALVSCRQDPIFYTISRENKILDPIIMGSPTNLVYSQKHECIYVASGSTLHRYKDGVWDDPEAPSKPGGKIVQLASSGDYLYALCFEDKDTDAVSSIKQFDGENWKEIGGDISNFYSAQHVYSAGDEVFISGVNSSIYSIAYSILYLDENYETKILPGVTGEITGAVYYGGFYYIVTKNNGIFKTADPASGEASSIAGSEGYKFTGIINLGANVAAITRDGNLYYVYPDSISVSIANFGSRFATGTLAVWQNPYNPGERLLLAGRQDELEYSTNSGYVYGYLELELEAGSVKAGAVFVEPGLTAANVTSVFDRDNDGYKTSIGTYPVNSILQSPSEIDSAMTLFASTQKNGVWSYRDRRETGASEPDWQWNAEE
jgi:hypothetical protein